jgi:hypothetical protein
VLAASHTLLCSCFLSAECTNHPARVLYACRLNAQVQEVQTAAWPRAHPLSSCEVAMLSNALSGNAALQRACEAMRAAAACVAQQHRLVSGCHTFYLVRDIGTVFVYRVACVY